jgi:NTP pyrophosphatase (non-canonical NTP hydrolase)
MTETIQRRAALDLVVIAEAIEVIDKALAEIGQRQLVTTTEVADLLLDVRQLLSERADSTTASTK